MSQYGDRREEHPNRKVSRDQWDPERIEARRREGKIKTHKDYPPEHGVPITQAEAYSQSQRAKIDRRMWEDLYGGDE